MTQLITHRPYTGEHDYQRLRAFLQSMYALKGPCPPITIGDLDCWRFWHPDPKGYIQSCGLWQDIDSHLVGFAWPGIEPDGDGIIDLCVHPQHANLLDAMLIWSEVWLQRAMPSDTLSLDVTMSALEHNAELTTVLTARGYSRTDHYHHWYRERSLAETVPDWSLPLGYMIRHMEGRGDMERLAELSNLSEAGEEITAATSRAMMDAPTYRRDLNLIVCAPDGTFAAFCIMWYDEINRVGQFEPVGCHPHHRRKGLARAMMIESLQRLRHLGATHALVTTSRRNQAANALYESLGFRSRDRKWYWKKTL